MKIILGLPPKELSPNSRCYWRVKAAATKAFRTEAQLMAINAMNEQLRPLAKRPRWKSAKVQCTFYRRTRHKTDPDNLISSVKAAFDGLTDAGVWSDDRDLTHLPPVTKHDPKNPRLEIEVNEE